jgi:hypothetical protein
MLVGAVRQFVEHAADQRAQPGQVRQQVLDQIRQQVQGQQFAQRRFAGEQVDALPVGYRVRGGRAHRKGSCLGATAPW